MPPLSCANATSAAKLFVQLCARNSGSTLDVLLPLKAQARLFCAGTARRNAVSTARTPILGRAGADINAGYRAIAGRRTFGISRPLAKTLAIHNPQTDDDGSDMMLEITPRAAHRLSQIMTKDKNPHLALRIQVESGGCHGFQYLMSLSTLPSASAPPLEPEQVAEDVTPSTTATASVPSPSALNEDDTIFAFAPDDAESAPATSPKVVLDLPSLELLKGSKVDYTMELIGSQFKIVDNPLATSSCGCGTSFDIKM
ncbi:putative iron transport protein [Rosellinia necatrix]|uniref:Putative iron transport protein n=1 Tax=Rosellinia necatrix TaxID=77044 RepID=A0A1W2TLT9_ROSNE|nr:putative iron transport protein [Rosellinia necatrix]